MIGKVKDTTPFSKFEFFRSACVKSPSEFRLQHRGQVTLAIIIIIIIEIFTISQLYPTFCTHSLSNIIDMSNET